jgi:hypothetical protein
LDGAIELPTRGGHPRRRTWPHGLALSTAAPAGEREEGENGEKEEEERDEVAACDNPPRKVPYYRLRPIHFGH